MFIVAVQRSWCSQQIQTAQLDEFAKFAEVNESMGDYVEEESHSHIEHVMSLCADGKIEETIPSSIHPSNSVLTEIVGNDQPIDENISTTAMILTPNETSVDLNAAVDVEGVDVVFEIHETNNQVEETKEDLSSTQYYCQVCMENCDSKDGYTLLACGHTFCRACLVAFLTSKITEAQVYPTCFHTTPVKDVIEQQQSAQSSTTDMPEGEALVSPPLKRLDAELYVCAREITVHDIFSLFENQPEMIDRFERFRFCKEHKNARECPYCHAYQLCDPLTTKNKVTCMKCEKIFCFLHSNAHNFDLYPTCELYEKSIEASQKDTMAFIDVTTKPCPTCGVRVEKTGNLLSSLFDSLVITNLSMMLASWMQSYEVPVWDGVLLAVWQGY